jgi:hypothetical protein
MTKGIVAFFITIFVFSGLFSFCQNTFELKIITPNEDRLNGIIEKNNGNFVFVGTKYNDYYNPTEISGYIIEVNSNGEILREKDIVHKDTLISFHDIIQNENGGYVVFGVLGSSITGFLNILAFIELDEEFNILKNYQHKIPDNRKSPGGSIFKNSNNDYVFFGSMLSSLPSTYAVYPILLEFSEDGNFINQKYFI